MDADGDGWVAGQNCDDDHASVYPGSTEFCADELDDDCDGLVDQDDPDCPSRGGADTGVGNHPKACLCSGSRGAPSRGLVLLLLSGGLLWRRRIRGR